ncbi:MAG: EamA family transporter, partial [Anaerolineaceae bacterium]
TFLAGMERIGPTNASTISTLEPAVTVILAGLLLGEELTIYKIIGGVLILAAVILLTRADKKEGTSKNNSVSSV